MSKKLKKNTPLLRFLEFEEDWNEKRLEELFSEFKSGYGITSEDINEHGTYPVFGGNGLRGYTKNFTHDGFYFLIGRQGALCGNINRINGKAYISEHAIACRANDTSDTEWLAHRLDYYNLNRLSESSAQPGLSVNKLLRFKLFVPSQKEQEKIASFLGAVDTRLNQLRRKRELLQTYKRGVMQKLFSQEVRFKNAIGSEFPDWENKQLNSIAIVNPSSQDFPDQFLYIDLERVNNGVLSEPELIDKENAPSRAQRVLKKGDILYQTVRPYQRNNLFFSLEGNYVASTGYAQLRARESPEFLYQLIHSDNFVDKVIARCTGTSYPAINSSDLANISILLPISIEEQEKIAHFLTAIDRKIEAISRQIDGWDQFKQGLLQKLFVQ
jgi:type I restriction enzyme, S subunit